MDSAIEVGYSDFNLCNEPVCLNIFCDIQLNYFFSHLTLSDPGYYDLEKYCINRHHVHVHFTRCKTHVAVIFFIINSLF